jgi:hypothetical protein
MLYRRILYLGQFAAAVALPTWVLIARGLLDDGVGWKFLVYVVVCPLLFVVMLAVDGLIIARASVRSSRTVSWLDAGLLSAWYLSIIAYGFWAWTLFAVLVVILAIALFWASVWQLFAETRARFRGLMAGFEEAAKPPASSGDPIQGPRVIVITPEDDKRSH